MFWIVALLATLTVGVGVVAPRRWPSAPAAVGVAAALGTAATSMFLLTGEEVRAASPLAARVEALRVRDPASLTASERLVLLRRIFDERPDDPQAARFYARELVAAGRDFEAIRAFERAARIAPDADVLTELGAAAVTANGGDVGDYARKVFEAALAEDPKHGQAAWYLALGEFQAGDATAAVDRWSELFNQFSPDDPRRLVFAMEAADFMARAPGRPTTGGGAAPPSPEAMVRRLEQRLEAEPRDLAGWLRLARANAVLGEAGRARDTLNAAAATFADDPGSLYFVVAARALWTADDESAGE